MSRTRSSAARRRAAEMGQNQSGFMPDGQQGDKKKKPEKKKWQPPAPPTRVGKKLKKKGLDGANRLPNVTPASKCLLRKLKLERVKDWLLMEEEFVGNQERIKPHTERAEEEKSKVDDLRGAPMSVGNLEEIIDDKCVPRGVRPGRRFRCVRVRTERGNHLERQISAHRHHPRDARRSRRCRVGFGFRLSTGVFFPSRSTSSLVVPFADPIRRLPFCRSLRAL